MKREDLIVETADGLSEITHVGDIEVYVKKDADSVMDAMEKRIKELESDLSMMETDYEFRIKNAVNIAKTTELKLQNRIKELEEQLHELAERECVLCKKKIKELEEQCTKYQAELMNNDPALNDIAKWVSVKDRLPNEYGDYLVVHKNCDDRDVIDVFAYAFDTKQGYACWVDDFEEDTSVTHWMPLPPTTEEK